MTLSEMKSLVNERGIQLTKSLGQNFLHDANQLRKIVSAAELVIEDKVLEIGPGLGPLTELLLAASGKVFAIEKDARLIEVLESRFAPVLEEEFPRLQLLHADALAWLQAERRNWAGWKLVSNLPYAVASPILVDLAQAEPGPDLLVATLQLEVARRLMAQSGDADYGVLTLLVQLNYEPRKQFKIPSGCFFPAPDVDSACIVMRRRAVPFLSRELQPMFNDVVKRSFSQRRKMMAKLLRTRWPADVVERAMGQAGLPLTIRAEAVDLRSFAELTQLFYERRNL